MASGYYSTFRSLGVWVEQNSLLIKQIPELAARASEAARQFREAFVAALPPNWSGLSMDEVFQVIHMIEATGFSVVWAPREEIVRELLVADPSARDALVLERKDAICDDLDALMGRGFHRRLRDIPNGVRAALAAYRGGYIEAAQALATVLLTSLIHGPLRIKSHATARDNFGRKYPTDATIEQLRLASITLAAAAALEDFNPMSMSPRHTRYNRHASAHSYLREQYNDLASLTALMLVVSLVCECDYWLQNYDGMPTDAGL
jgi:hypothetical protein